MRKYIEMNEMNETLKQKIKDQLTVQSEFWINFLSGEPKMYNLTKTAKTTY
eukprot:CAMPEP_0114578184 /NCGR_PEP_ID=MMETSP0125-20121206/2749_1 /TAXON_ID=485358 ORGANISM="Aristerostoma sp., Strain ATCC 50986" /NCGR_SAMPLE_ID=MMETSP0125 /ASSEMBLY_ACC=CAM_ASM_000245 /LENGTH=50 /DNA_ID=CAMNT_0001768051 /DNA_START=1494 /DNA_END=1646 /DNA_ORIENTATION=+